jgi:hypothetical protein
LETKGERNLLGIELFHPLSISQSQIIDLEVSSTSNSNFTPTSLPKLTIHSIILSLFSGHFYHQRWAGYPLQNTNTQSKSLSGEDTPNFSAFCPATDVPESRMLAKTIPRTDTASVSQRSEGMQMIAQLSEATGILTSPRTGNSVITDPSGSCSPLKS